jgi:uncharacterized protein YndB with AHSA1/START domain
MPKIDPKLRFVYVTYINTTPKKLWEALINPELIEQYWMGRHNTSKWKRGAAIESRSPDGELEWRGEIVESKPPRRLVYSFGGADSKEEASRVTFEIDSLDRKKGPQGEALRLTVTHDKFPPRSKSYAGVSEGWPAILSGLKSLLETGRSLGISWKF